MTALASIGPGLFLADRVEHLRCPVPHHAHKLRGRNLHDEPREPRVSHIQTVALPLNSSNELGEKNERTVKGDSDL